MVDVEFGYVLLTRARVVDYASMSHRSFDHHLSLKHFMNNFYYRYRNHSYRKQATTPN